MFALDLFNNDHERHLTEGAVDQLEQRRIDDLAMKMDDLVARAKTATTPEVKAALVKEFQKCKQERDSYFNLRCACATRFRNLCWRCASVYSVCNKVMTEAVWH